MRITLGVFSSDSRSPWRAAVYRLFDSAQRDRIREGYRWCVNAPPLKRPGGETYAFGFRAVQDRAPNASGIYGIFTSRRWLHVGKSDDIRESLFHCLNHPDAAWSTEDRPLSFSFETAPTAAAAP